ncbi:MAG: HupE/UreJ family protein [Pseudomonadota bacterium]
MRRWRGLLCLLLAFAVSPAAAHLLNMSRAEVELAQSGDVRVTLSLDLLRTVGDRQRYYELSELSDPINDPDVLALLAELPSAVRIVHGNRLVALTLASIRFPDEPASVFLDPLSWPRTDVVLTGINPDRDIDWRPAPLTVQFTDAFFLEEPIATTIIEPATGKSQTRWLVTNQRSPVFQPSALSADETTQIPDDGGVWAAFSNYVVAGIRHILPGGFDHLLFVTGLLLASRSIRQLAVTVSLFTLAHSVTLIVGALGWVQPWPWLVEPLILASIAWVGLSNLRGAATGAASRVVVFLFGLLHGFGFAGALRELALPSEQTLPALLAFNIGVEVGQLGFLLVLLAAYSGVTLLRRPIATTGLLPVPRPLRQLGGALLVGASAWLCLDLGGLV